MDQFNQQLNPPPKNWFSRHMVLGYVFLGLIFAGIVGGVYWFQERNSNEPYYGKKLLKDCVITGDTFSCPSNPNNDTSDWKTYKDTRRGFELKYPPEWTWNMQDNSLRFSASNGYQAIFDIEPIPSVEKDFTIDEMRKEYDRQNTGNSKAPKASEVLEEIYIGTETGLEWAGILCAVGHPCLAKYEFYSNSTWKNGFEFYLSILELKDTDLNSSYNPRPLFVEDIIVIRKVLSTFKFIN